MARGLSRFWLWTAPLTVGIGAALVLGAGFVLALRGAAGKPLGQAPPPEPAAAHSAAVPRDGVFRILVVGDSLAKGTGDDTGKGFAVNVLEAFRKKGKAEITNLAVNGMESPDILALVESPNVRALAAGASLILVSVGGNDLSHSLTRGAATEVADAMADSRGRYAKNLRSLLADLREANATARICVLGLYDPFGGDEARGRLGASVILQWNALIAETALSFPNVTVIPTFDLFQGRPDRLSADHYHPNAQAYEEIARRMLQVV
jgi:lysophospholipase L1-like esterase